MSAMRFAARLVPVVDLQAHDHTDDDDRELGGNGAPLLLPEALQEATKDHGVPCPVAFCNCVVVAISILASLRQSHFFQQSGVTRIVGQLVQHRVAFEEGQSTVVLRECGIGPLEG
ncbi:MAG: hypothetical protein PF480_01225, partial [Roseovarius sp.]|nr:hypothetical protein [Roseovarius sp.]